MQHSLGDIMLIALVGRKRFEMQQLKLRIATRLNSEDYRCRLPTVYKRRCRYKLTRQVHVQYTDGYLYPTISQVYK